MVTYESNLCNRKKEAQVGNMKTGIEYGVRDLLLALSKGAQIEVEHAVLVLLYMDKPYTTEDSCLTFYTNGDEKVIIPVRDPGRVKKILEEMALEYGHSIFDIKNYVKHNFSLLLEDHRKSSLGKYYTPEHLVGLVHELVKPYVSQDSYVLDLAAGSGAFLGPFKGKRIIAADIDRIAVLILKALGFESARYDNSLVNICRAKYALKESDHIIVVGNPPYNDVTSRNKKYGRFAKQRIRVEMDKDILTNDLGISFLRAFNKLKADVICVLHPLSYLIKKTNFGNKLGEFRRNYVLKRAVVFPSREFADTQQTPFPVVAALYQRDMIGMDYDYIRNFEFEILHDKRSFVLARIETIDGYIRKYPPVKRDKNKKSDIGLYMHNIRDINSLITIGYLTEKEDFDRHITINYCDLYKYAYLNCMRRYLEKDFKFGNLSPIVDRRELERDEFLRDAFVIDTIINNQRLSVFDVKNKSSIVYMNSLAEEYERKRRECAGKEPGIYTMFLEFVSSGSVDVSPLRRFIAQYFERLKTKMIC